MKFILLYILPAFVFTGLISGLNLNLTLNSSSSSLNTEQCAADIPVLDECKSLRQQVYLLETALMIASIIVLICLCLLKQLIRRF